MQLLQNLTYMHKSGIKLIVLTYTTFSKYSSTDICKTIGHLRSKCHYDLGKVKLSNDQVNYDENWSYALINMCLWEFHSMFSRKSDFIFN